jgi:hypothetical protein
VVDTIVYQVYHRAQWPDRVLARTRDVFVKLWYMGATTSVTPRALTLSGLLKTAIEESPLSVRAVAKLMSVSHPTVLGWIDSDNRRVPNAETVAALLAHLGVNGDRRERILEIARMKDEPDWLTTGRAGISQQLAGVMELERSAVAMVDWSPLCVPGMLQTDRYARAIIGSNPRLGATEVDHLVKVRLGRQNALMREKPVRLTALLGVPAIQGGIGGRDVMAEQLRYLVRASTFGTVTLQVVGVDGDWHGGLSGPFLLYERPGLPTILHCEHHRTGTFVTEAADVAGYEELTNTLRELACSPEESRGLITEQVKKWETT